MIPKIIHFCWLSGDPYPKKIQQCIDSWKRHLPDYEIWLWDVNRFDINSSIWVKEAFEHKKYAFCADYIRAFALYNYGGIYLDSDVEVVKSYNDLLDLPYFVGYESSGNIEAATMGFEKGNDIMKQILNHYENLHFVKSNGEYDVVIMPLIIKSAIEAYEIKEIKSKHEFEYDSKVLNIFPYDWFSPIDSTGKRFVLRATENTYSIHHFVSAWVDPKVMFLVKVFGFNSPTRYRIQKIAKWIRENIVKKIKNIKKSRTV